MDYDIQKAARIAGVSTRTLRYYDQIGLLKPAGVNASGYRMYGSAEMKRLQRILFYRTLGVELKRIGRLMESPGFDAAAELKSHRSQLLERRTQLDDLIKNIEKAINEAEGGIPMNDKERFEGFKKSLIEENERNYGREIREKYGEEVVAKSNERLAGMSQEQYEQSKKLEEQMFELLKEAMAEANPSGEKARKAAALHRQVLELFWPSYSKEAHGGLAAMYVEDERFKTYYDNIQPGMAVFLRDAILSWLKD